MTFVPGKEREEGGRGRGRAQQLLLTCVLSGGPGGGVAGETAAGPAGLLVP